MIRIENKRRDLEAAISVYPYLKEFLQVRK
jgi:hypothetical protein